MIGAAGRSSRRSRRPARTPAHDTRATATTAPPTGVPSGSRTVPSIDPVPGASGAMLDDASSAAFESEGAFCTASPATARRKREERHHHSAAMTASAPATISHEVRRIYDRHEQNEGQGRGFESVPDCTSRTAVCIAQVPGSRATCPRPAAQIWPAEARYGRLLAESRRRSARHRDHDRGRVGEAQRAQLVRAGYLTGRRFRSTTSSSLDR